MTIFSLKQLLAFANVSPTTANVTFAKNTLTFLDLSGLTANRNGVIPAGVEGDVIEINVLVGDDTYFLILLGDTGITVNGLTASAFFALHNIGDTLTLVATSTTNWQCRTPLDSIVLYDATKSVSTEYNFPIIVPQLPYAWLDIEGSFRVNNTAANYFICAQINGDTTMTNYYTTIHRSGASPTQYTYDNSIIGLAPGSTATAGRFCQIRASIIHPVSSVFRKLFDSMCIMQYSTTTEMWSIGIEWENTNAITSLLVYEDGGNPFVAGTRCRVIGRFK